jgi:hypothetical protein
MPAFMPGVIAGSNAGEPAASGWTGAGIDAGGGVVDVPGRLAGGT